MLGAAVLCAAALIVVYSVLLRAIAGGQVQGDFEIVSVASGIAILLFLPYCQARRAHVTVDVFTAWLPPAVLRRVDLLWSCALSAGAAVLAWRLGVGLAEAWQRNDVSMILHIPLTLVFVAAVIGVAGTSILALLQVVAAPAGSRNGHVRDR